MSVRGSLATMSVEDLLSWVDRRFLCGSLTVERGPVTRTLSFDSGYITAASSNVPGEHLGRLLAATGAIDDAALREAYQVQRDTGVLLGKILQMTGAVDEPLLARLIEGKIRRGVFDALSWREGSFSFEPDVAHASSAYQVSVNLREVLAEGVQLLADLAALEAARPADDAILRIADEAAATGAEGPWAALVAGVRQKRPVGALLGEADGGPVARLRRLRALTELLEGGVLAVERRVRARTAGGTSADELAAAARGRAAGGDRLGALGLARKALECKQDDEELRRLHHELERALFAELSRDLLSSFRVPRLLKSQNELAELELNETERSLAGRVDGRWDLLSLIRVAPCREVEALITFKRLADRGIISL